MNFLDTISFPYTGTRSITISDYLEFVKPRYVYLKITPSTSLRNYSSDKILSLVASLYKTFQQKISFINKKLFFECESKISYYIYMEKNQAMFYFIVPEKHYLLFKEKISDIWNNRITISIVPEIPLFNQECTKYFLTYKKEDTLSLSCDKRNNTLLQSLLGTVHMMEEGDKVGIFYNFSSINQSGWREKFDNTMERLKEDMPVNKSKMDLLYIGNYILQSAFRFVDIFLECISLSQPSKAKPLKDIVLLDDTRKKRDSVVVKTQILCMSESKDKLRENNNAINACESFKCLDGDNRLIYHKCSKSSANNILDVNLMGVDSIHIQPREGQNFISLPAREILDEHKFIEHTNVLETEVPRLLREGYICLGENIYKGSKTKAYLRDTYDQGNFPLVLIGEQGSGKTTFISNYVNDIISRKEGCLVIDYIKNCDLISTIENSIPKDRIKIVDMSDVNNVQGIGYNELKPRNNKNVLEILDIANRKSLYISMLIDALNSDGEPLSTSMDRYLNAASNIVFLNSAASLKDVIRCLNDHNYRKKCIENISDSMKEYLEDEIIALQELDEKNKAGDEIVGTKNIKVDGINHRINLLRKDFRLKMMFNKSCVDNIDLVKEMEEGKIVLIKMPQEYFSTPYSKNVIVTYLLTKVWSSMLVRGGLRDKPKRFHIIVDELFQCKTAMQLLRDQEILPQTRKFGCKFVISCQDLGQIGMINQTLRSAGASYMFLKGSGKSNFNEFKEELSPYTLEDLEALPQYYSLNLINYEGGRAKFITKLPNRKS